MKSLLALIFIFLFYVGLTSDIEKKEINDYQSGNMFFCEYYDPVSNMPINIGNRFTKGNLCVVANLGYQINQHNVVIQLDRLNPLTGNYEYYNAYNFIVNPNYSYIYFNNVYFGLSGTYRVFLLYSNRVPIISGLIEII